MLISQTDQVRISAAIAEAERKTSGEIVAVVTGASDSYLYIALLWAALSALLVPLPLIYLTKWPVQHIYALQLATFACVALLLQWRPLRMRLVPGPVKRGRAHRNAMEQFLVQDLHTTKGRTGVLIFVSVAERFVEVIADEGIHQKVRPGLWDDVVRDLTDHIKRGEAGDGFVRAVGECGAVLAEHFPPDGSDEDELPNHLIVI
ncbi:MAG: TPM domain-containing protein [Methyloligellaceae bacterium]